ncbi:MAG: Cof-type family hydrolase [Bacteroidetes bacterium]|nr:Cof-type family hydrolase [Bacteroidota bacterium]
MIKAVFFDIDGTMVSFETHQVPQSTQDAIVDLRKKGIRVFVATGRHRSAINNLANITFDGYITINGGYCTVENDICIYKRSIEKSDIEALIEFQKNRPFPCMIVEETRSFINFLNDDVEHVLNMLNFPTINVRPLEEALNSDVLQLVSFFTENKENTVMSVLPNCESTRWYPLFTDIVPKGSHKGIGMDKIIAYYGISLDETMAFGDGGNDISMLQHAGIGVAMGNADDEVKASADFVTDTVDADGIYKALNKFGVL